MTLEQARLMRFALKYPAGWHSYGADVTPTVRRLASHGLLDVSTATKQFRLAIGDDARATLRAAEEAATSAPPAPEMTPCPFCKEPVDLTDPELESTWQQWQCPCCGSWNDKESR